MKWYKEPLVHFLLIGAALFVLYSILNEDRESSPQRKAASINLLIESIFASLFVCLLWLAEGASIQLINCPYKIHAES